MFGLFGAAQAGLPCDTTDSYGFAANCSEDTSGSWRQDAYGPVRIGYGDSLYDVWGRTDFDRRSGGSYHGDRFGRDDFDRRYEATRDDWLDRPSSRWSEDRFDRNWRELSSVPVYHPESYRPRHDDRDLYRRDRMFEPWPGNYQASTPGRRLW